MHGQPNNQNFTNISSIFHDHYLLQCYCSILMYNAFVIVKTITVAIYIATIKMKMKYSSNTKMLI
jgi:hypothetical protein